MNSLRIDPGMVHEILSSPNIPFGEKTAVLQIKNAVGNLEKMLHHLDYFSICEVRRTIEALSDDGWRNLLNNREYNDLAKLHCIHWNTMPTAFKKEVETKVWELILPLVAKQFDFDKYLGSATVVEEAAPALAGPTTKRKPWEVWK